MLCTHKYQIFSNRIPFIYTWPKILIAEYHLYDSVVKVQACGLKQSCLNYVNKSIFSQASLGADIAQLQAGQNEIVKEIKAIREQTQDLVEFEAEMRLKVGPLIAVTKDNTYDIAVLKNRVG